ncbi:unnamed protein product (macronuclear) [Paramecium tetraurelia]|uniref:DUF4515 domain-containing protein n=1 Tax=Paramecium tetraurelia TaxID=5888 RepID=A0BMY1_PARTE|nr:uncharacterized protein GSPATT00030535001 [Paramecium tetraurelia]CAK59898.1 unnamed protein product [Paramecium tetraurelia]|eukprot:XP_001427296.1 hypothetical protein (macronuclear) [Paramecium tetraurelia strain d4-2]
MLDYIKEKNNIIITKQKSGNSLYQSSESSPINLLGNHKKQRFPTISNAQLKSAIEQNYLEPGQKHTIIRNPNQLTVFQMQFDMNSPRTQAAMEMLKIHEDDLNVQEYANFYQKKLSQLQNLVQYLQYVSNKYQTLNDLLKRRNQIKHIQSEVTKRLNSKDIKIKDQSLIAEQPEPKNTQREDSQISVILNADQKKELFEKKINKESENYNKFLNIVQDQVNKQEEYYSKTAPEIYEKAEQLKQKKLDQIKKKLKRKNQKVDQICQKIKQEEQLQYRKHKKIVQELEKDLDQHFERKQKLLLQSQEELVDQLKKKEEKERERQLKRQIQISLEQSMINQVMESMKKKSDYLNDYLNRKQLEDRKKQQQSLKMFEEKQKKLQESSAQKENEYVKMYFSKSTQRQIQLNKHEISQIKQQKSLSMKNSRIMQKYEQYQESLDQKRSDSLISKLQEADDKLENGLKRHQSLLDLRKQNLCEKNEHRFKLAKEKQMENMLEKIHKQNKILEKNLEISQKNEKNKQELEFLEKYKKEIMLDKLIQRNQKIQKLQS